MDFEGRALDEDVVEDGLGLWTERGRAMKVGGRS